MHIVLRTSLIWLAVVSTFAFSQSSFATDAHLRIDGDLMIHPDQMANFFEIGARKIHSSPSWDWPSLQFTKPYKTAWTNVKAKGPFNIQFDTTHLNAQEFSFELTWADPEVEVGTFEIHDTIVRESGGNKFVIHLDGQCSNMTVRIAGGAWKVRGRMRWDYASGQFKVAWQEFDMQANTAAGTGIDSGDCVGQSDMIKALREAAVSITHDQTWLSDIVKLGVQDWAQTTMDTLQAEVLMPRQIQVKDNIAVGWEPSQLSVLSGGLIRVAGQFVMSKPGSAAGAELVARDYDPSAILGQVKESGFIMPTTSLQKITGYMFSNRELQYRIKSDEIPSFVGLMKSRFIQFFIWPDLMQFAKKTVFYFDLTTGQSPQFSNGQMVDSGGSRYEVSTAMIVHQWAPGNGVYVPYIDFRSVMNGQVVAKISDETLSIQMNFSKLKVDSKFRSEFDSVRGVNKRIATSFLGSRVADYLNQNRFTIPVPSWDLGQGLSLGLRDLQAWKDSFRIPLDFKAVAPQK